MRIQDITIKRTVSFTDKWAVPLLDFLNLLQWNLRKTDKEEQIINMLKI